MMQAFVLVLLTTLTLPLVAASGTLVTGPVTLVLDEGHDQACVEDTSGLCVGSLSGDEIGRMQVDAYERFHSIGVVVNASHLESLLGVELLPDGSFTFIPASIVVPHPTYRLLIDNVGRTSVGPVIVWFKETDYGVAYFGPGAYPLNTTFAEHGVRTAYGEEGPEEGVLERDQVRPSQDFGSASTDALLEDTSTLPCDTADATCDITNATINSIENATPDVRAGLAVYQLALATDPAAFSAPLARQGTPAPAPLARASALHPLSRAPDHPSATPIPTIAASQHERASDATHAPPRPPPASTTTPAMAPAHERTPSIPLAITTALALAIILAAFYARMNGRAQALQNERRARMLELIRTQGPLTIAELSHALGIDRTTALHHARMLRRTGVLKLEHTGHRCYAALPHQPIPTTDPGTRQQHLLDTLRAHGGTLTRSALHEAARDIPHRSRNRALRDLVDTGALERTYAEDGEEVLRIAAQAWPAP